MCADRLADLRTTILNLDQAKSTFDRMAQLTIYVEAEDARFERKIVDAKIAHFSKQSEMKAEIAALKELIVPWVAANPGEFGKSRKVKTELGSFGYQTVTDTVIEDDVVVLDHCMENGYDDCVATQHKLIKPALRKRVEAGETIPGVVIRNGDTVVCNVSKTLIAKARAAVAEG